MTSRDRTAQFKELRRLYKPHSIKVRDISKYLRSAATNISHKAHAKLSKSSLAHKLRIRVQDPYNSDDSELGLLHRNSNSSRSDSDASSGSDDPYKHHSRPKLPFDLAQALREEPLWMRLLGDIDGNIPSMEKQC